MVNILWAVNSITSSRNHLKRRGRRFGHVVRMKATLANPILQAKVEGKISRGMTGRPWLNNVNFNCKGMHSAEFE